LTLLKKYSSNNSNTVLIAKAIGISPEHMIKYFDLPCLKIVDFSKLNNKFSQGKNHINGIESFCDFYKRRIAKQNGLRKDKFLCYA